MDFASQFKSKIQGLSVFDSASHLGIGSPRDDYGNAPCREFHNRERLMIEQLQKELAALRKRNHALSHDLSDARNICDQYAREIEELRDQLERSCAPIPVPACPDCPRLRSDVQNLRESNKSLQEENQNLERERYSLTSELNAVKRELQSAADYLVNIEKDLSNAVNEKNSALADLSNARATVMMHEHTIQSLKLEMESLRSELSKAKQMLKDTFPLRPPSRSSSNSSVVQKIRSPSPSLPAIDSSSDVEMRRLNQEVGRWRRQCQALEKQVSVLLGEKRALEIRYREDIDILHQQIRELSEELQRRSNANVIVVDHQKRVNSDLRTDLLNAHMLRRQDSGSMMSGRIGPDKDSDVKTLRDENRRMHTENMRLRELLSHSHTLGRVRMK